MMKRIKERAEHERMPIVIYTGKELSKTEETDLRKLAQTIIIKDVKSPERLLDETALFLHRVQESLPESAREMLRSAGAARTGTRKPARCRAPRGTSVSAPLECWLRSASSRDPKD